MTTIPTSDDTFVRTLDASPAMSSPAAGGTCRDPRLQEALARVHGTPARPKCLCRRGDVRLEVQGLRDQAHARNRRRTSDDLSILRAAGERIRLGEVLG